MTLEVIKQYYLDWNWGETSKPSWNYLHKKDTEYGSIIDFLEIGIAKLVLREWSSQLGRNESVTQPLLKLVQMERHWEKARRRTKWMELGQKCKPTNPYDCFSSAEDQPEVFWSASKQLFSDKNTKVSHDSCHISQVFWSQTITLCDKQTRSH